MPPSSENAEVISRSILIWWVFAALDATLLGLRDRNQPESFPIL